MSSSSQLRVQEILHQKDDKITAAEYVYDEFISKGKTRQHRVIIKRDEFEHIAAVNKKPWFTFENFTKITRPLLMANDAEEDIPEAFQLLDLDKSDKIDINELAVFMPAIVPNSNPYMMLRYFQSADTNSDYGLNLDEFTAFIKKGVIRDLALGRT
ncbi:unnamed protein product [Rotaria magnacalcarata]|uniref:EF-hand domain-containing protein n=1 Tax=Rotaria magnacalcarata TaxID=392030 RepID=A0A814XWQ4_9BILA|nr:unnamed protein product [Rotaria magnacalcarata]CAF1656696.1 unnamed protein product [Rotaria magnacalcarata]CAF2150617.1 unnamed protein product [Rotaria magnacalcarata]CAF3776236.1 unnamed protein product [Rotaria magnacalcarata]CAF3809795.1 unnamed protein product [Rotaria magnacalcarata]